MSLDLYDWEASKQLCPGETASGLKCSDVLSALRSLHSRRSEWAYFEEMRIGTGYGPDSEQRLDAWAMHLFPSQHWERRAYEVKVSRSDFLAEIKKPAKRKHALLLSNRFYFVAPAGLIKPVELPAEAGLIEVGEGGRCRVTVAAPWRDAMPVTGRFLAAICRRVSEAKGGTP